MAEEMLVYRSLELETIPAAAIWADPHSEAMVMRSAELASRKLPNELSTWSKQAAPIGVLPDGFDRLSIEGRGPLLEGVDQRGKPP